MPSCRRQVASVCHCDCVCVGVCVWQACYVLPVAQAVNYVRQHIELVRLIGAIFCSTFLSKDASISHDFFSSFPSFLCGTCLMCCKHCSEKTPGNYRNIFLSISAIVIYYRFIEPRVKLVSWEISFNVHSVFL